MSRRRTKRYDLPRVDLNGIKLPRLNLPKVALPLDKLKLAKVRLPWSQILALGVIVVLGYTMLNLNTRLGEYNRLKGENQTLSTQIGGLEATRGVLETQLAYVGSDAAVIDAARQAHMVREGEKLIVVLTPSSEQAAVTPPATQEEIDDQVPQPWEIWMALFFGR